MMKSSRIGACLIVLVVSLSPGYVAADTIFGIYAGAGAWFSEYNGDFSSDDAVDINLGDDLSFDKDNANSFYVAIEHPIPVLPNFRVQRTEVAIDENSELASQIEFDGAEFSSTEEVTAKLDLTHTDLTLYYEVLDNWVSLDLGVTVRVFDGEVLLQGTTIDPDTSEPVFARQEIDVPIPMLYGKARFDLPFSGLAVEAEGNILEVSGNGVADATLKLAYEAKFGIGAEIGYRVFQLTLDDQDDLNAEVTIDGIYIGLSLHI
ncbi:MAG: hypothetical protein COB04_02010 [Gammaproteobacteria bacterium]|nr:MAG: hypothetical protein COB04_02010 [Gammaproteobacteria bacterium]